MVLTDKSHYIKTIALKYGFSHCGIAMAEALPKETGYLKFWIQNSFHAGLAYMEKNIDKRTDPRLLVENAKSVIVLAMNYYPGEAYQKNTKYKVARYALGKDYHDILKDKCSKLIEELQTEFKMFFFKSYVDSAPLMEKAWAARAGLGAIGKNGLLIIPGAGSYFTLCVILTDTSLEYDEAFKDNLCGGCTLCMDSCPVSAIVKPGCVDARKCIAALTIERNQQNDSSDDANFHDRIFGCDICQEVCPENRFSRVSSEKDFLPYPFFLNVTDGQWENMSVTEFNELFARSPLKRATYQGITKFIV